MVTAKKKQQSGMSLVELMVAMVIGLFLTAGVFTMFSMSSSNVTTTSQFNQLQENGRIALAILERDLSQLAFMGDMTGTDFVLATNTRVFVSPALASDCVGGGLNNATLPNNFPAHFRRLWGYEQGKSSVVLACLSGVKANTDVLQMKRLIGPAIAAPSGNNVFVATDASQAVFFTPPIPAEALAPAMANARYWEYQHHVYYIDEANGIPILNRKTLTGTGMSNDDQLVEGIENIRFLYGFDNDGDSTPDSFMPAEDVTSLMWDNESFQRLVAIKIFLLVRTVTEDKTYTNENTYQLGDKSITYPIPDEDNNVQPDHYRRKVLSTTVVLENPVLIRS